jgi:hypothetical protein
MRKDERRPAKNAVVAPLPQISRDQANEASGATPVQRMLVLVASGLDAALNYPVGSPERNECCELVSLLVARGVTTLRRAA